MKKILLLIKKSKSALHRFILNQYRYLVLVNQGNTIGCNCYVSKLAKLDGENKIGDKTIIGDHVWLKKGARICNNSVLDNIEIGLNSFVESGVICTGYGEGKIIIGDESYIGINNILDWSSNISIGNFVHVAGPSTGLWTHSSAKMCIYGIPLETKDQKFRPTAPIVIEDNVYIGGNCTIYPGVVVHHHAIVAPNSVVTKDVDAYTMIGCGSAQFVKKIRL